MKKVIVGMSGGVDSSVTALLLKKQGFNVIGVFMKNWEEDSDLCPAQADYQDVVAVCNQLDIPYYSVNFAQQYWEEVFSKCLKNYAAGYTPNPDILCNREIKFKAFFEKALELGGDYLATGHYCQKFWDHNEWRLGRGADPEKDQGYFLYTIKNSILERVLFPIGGMTKKEVRAYAEQAGLATAQKKDSTGICFIGKRDFKDFLGQYLPRKPGRFETKEGQIVGEHDGVAFYTIGQRKGLGLGGAGQAWYVIGKNIEKNVVIVERGEHHDLFYESLKAVDASWVGAPPSFPLTCTAKIRYRSPDVTCTVLQAEDNQVTVQFDKPQKAVTPGQSVVFYQGDFCLGGAFIAP